MEDPVTVEYITQYVAKLKQVRLIFYFLCLRLHFLRPVINYTPISETLFKSLHAEKGRLIDWFAKKLEQAKPKAIEKTGVTLKSEWLAQISDMYGLP